MADGDQVNWPRVRQEDVRSFVERCLTSVGMKGEFASDLGDLILAADYRGHYSHGLNRLGNYVMEAKTDNVNKAGDGPKVLKETAATAWVDGNNIPGPTIGKFCMKLAIEKAKELGVAWVTVKNANHFGIAGFYSMMAAKEGLMGLAYTNTSPATAPTRSKKPVCGTNAVSAAAPGPNGDDFVLDMATTTVSYGKVELARVKGEQIPNSWVCDKNGKETNDPQNLFEGGSLLPLGGSEKTGGYKGFGLNLMVEYFCSVLSGATMTPFCRRWELYDKPADLGQCFVAVNPNAFAPDFKERSGTLMATMRNLEPIEGEEPVLVAGDPERSHMKLCDQLGGIPYHQNQIQVAKELAKKLEVEELRVILK